MNGMNGIVSYAQGNPGALNFLMDLFMAPDSNNAIIKSVSNKLDKCPSIRGTNLYVLHSDLCGKDLNKVKQLCDTCPDHILEDACNRQDYSGRELVKEYLV